MKRVVSLATAAFAAVAFAAPESADMVIYGGRNEAVINLVCSKIDAFLKEHNSKEKEE